jgi:N-acyl-D-amino-acid deacylase
MRTPLLAVMFLSLPTTSLADDPQRAAIEKGLRRLEQGAANYVEKRTCFSCHHQAMSVFSMAAAQRQGFVVEPARLKRQIEFTLNSFRPKLHTIRKGEGVAGGNTTAAYALATLEAGGHPADEVTTALVDYLLRKQREDGAWPGVADRPPSEGSPFTSTALTIKSLKAYGATATQEDAAKHKERIDRAIERGRNWLLKAVPSHTEDRVFRLRGLHFAGAEAAAVETARAELLKAQGQDGGWPQFDAEESDAYATGSVLVALRETGLPPDHPAVRKGVRFLLETQKPDGSWFVETRSKPVQVFFDNGDPGGKSQFISSTATGWAVLALLESLPPPK